MTAVSKTLTDLETLADQGIPNMFYFWDNLDTVPDGLKENLEFARSRFPKWTFTVMDDAFALALLQRDWPEIAKEYSDIWIPACRSDIARIAALYAFGGWYIDADTRPVGDLEFYTQDKHVFVFRDVREKMLKRGDLMNGFIYMPRRSPIAKRMLEIIMQNLKERKDVYRVMDFAGPYLLAKLVKKAEPFSVVKLWQSRHYKRYNETLVGDDPLFVHTVDDTASSWRIVQNFGVLPDLEPNWAEFPKELRPRFVPILRNFANQHNMHHAIVDLAKHRPSYLDRPGFVALLEECQAVVDKRQTSDKAV